MYIEQAQGNVILRQGYDKILLTLNAQEKPLDFDRAPGKGIREIISIELRSQEA
jgi:hypothetical protein